MKPTILSTFVLANLLILANCVQEGPAPQTTSSQKNAESTKSQPSDSQKDREPSQAQDDIDDDLGKEVDQFHKNVQAFVTNQTSDPAGLDQVLSSKSLTMELIQSPEILGFLSRSQEPEFIESIVTIDKSGGYKVSYQKNHTLPKLSTYESKIYHSLCEHRIHIPFRSVQPGTDSQQFDCNVSDKFFYNIGTPHFVSAWLADKLISSNPVPGVSIISQKDIYQMGTTSEQISKDSTRASFENAGLEFIIYPGGKDNHAFTTLGLINHNKQELVGHLLINTWRNPQYFAYLDYRIDLFNHRKDTDRKPLFLDASLELQLAADDSNCALYTHLLTKQLATLIKNNEDFRGHIIGAFDASDGLKQANAIESLRLALEKNLPAFYKCTEFNCVRREDKEIKEFFLRYRWQLGSDYLKFALPS